MAGGILEREIMDESILLKGEYCTYEGKVEVEYRAFVEKCRAQFPDPRPDLVRKPKVRRPNVKRTLLRKQSNKCLYCECHLDARSMTIDHMIPRSRGGSNTLENLAAACSKCNNAKGSMTKDEYLETVGAK